MVRPRGATDAEIVERVSAFLGAREWPSATWTLAEVAPAAGLSPAGILKRFGSRAGLLRALGQHWLDTIPGGPRFADPLTELRTYCGAMFAAPSAAAALGGLGDLLADLADETSAALLREGSDKQARYVAALLRGMALPRVGDQLLAARVLLDALHGGLIRGASGAGNAGVPAGAADTTIDYFLTLWR